MAPSFRRPRFTPKPLDLDEHVVWVLKRAFGPPDRAVSPGDPEAALYAADALGYLPRIGQRTPRERLEAELGRRSDLPLQATHQAAASAAMLNGTTRFVATVAREFGLPAVFLKFAALSALGIVRPGSRFATDVDVLPGRHHGAALIAALVARGARVLDPAPRLEHELAGLVSPLDAAIDVHRYLPGVRFDAHDRFVTADELLAAGLVDPTTNAPRPDVLAAHTLVHGFVENAPIPQTAGPPRTLADLVDIERFAPGSLAGAASVLGGLFDDQDFQELKELVSALERGEIEAGWDDRGASWLSHVLGTALDREYAASLRKFLFTAPLSERAGVGPRLERIVHMLVPTAAELSRIYGEPSGRFSLLLWRLWRPIDLGVRAFRLL